MNRAAALHLLEIATYAQRLGEDLQAGKLDEDDTVVFGNEMEHLLTHFALAWHYARMSDDELKELSPEQWKALTLALPMLNSEYRLVEPWSPVV